MKRFWIIGIIGLLACLMAITGCNSSLGTVVREQVTLVDDLACQNELIVTKLVLDRASVTEDEEAIAIRNARLMKLLTNTMKETIK